jgi:predicted glutamine amidotransferase
MCRLFAMSGGGEPVSARVWLLEAPDSLSAQSHHNPDGTGLGIFAADGRPTVHKAPISAFSDTAFAAEARTERSRTFLAHIRFASTGAKTIENTHPFEEDGRLFAHNGVLTGLERIEARLGPDTDLLHGQTDSERLFALITHETRRHGGDLRAGILAAVGWIAAEVPIYSLNFVIATADGLFVLRYPDTNTLYVLERGAAGEPLHHHSSFGTCVRSEDAASHPVVVFASEPMDDDPGWRPLDCGELVHVDAGLGVTSEIAFPDPPAQLIDLHELDAHGRASQGEATKRGPTAPAP